MKALFKLKHFRFDFTNYYTSKQAQEEYQKNKRVPRGFYSEILTFEEYIKLNYIKIID